MGGGGFVGSFPRAPGSILAPAPAPAPFTGFTIKAPTFPGFGSGQSGAAANAGAVGVKGAMAGMATAFAAAIVVEVVFWLLDKLTGGKLSGSAKMLNAEPADMKQSAVDMQTAAKEMKQQAGTIDALTQKLGGLWQSASQLKAIKDLAEFNKGVATAADQKFKLGDAVTEIAQSVAKGQQSFLDTTKKYGAMAVSALSSFFGGFMAIVIAGLAFKLIMVLVSKVVGEVGSKGNQIRSTAGANVSAIAAEVQARAQAARAAGPSTLGTTSAGGPSVTAGPGSPGWIPVPPSGSTGTITVSATAQGITFEGDAGRDYRIVAKLPDGKEATLEVDADPAPPT